MCHIVVTNVDSLQLQYVRCMHNSWHPSMEQNFQVQIGVGIEVKARKNVPRKKK